MKKLITTILTVLVFSTSISTVKATDPEVKGIESFVKIAPFDHFANEIPTVVNVKLTKENLSEDTWAVWNADKNDFVASNIYKKVANIPTPKVKLLNEKLGREGTELYDGKTWSYIDMPLDSVKQETQLLFEFPDKFDFDRLDIIFGKFSNIPEKISISAGEDEITKKVIFDKMVYYRNVVNFPSSEAKFWWVTFHHSQPLRISEMSFSDSENTKYDYYLQFLALKGVDYQLLFSPERLNLPIRELPDFSQSTHNLDISLPILVPNPLYIAPDQDTDGVKDELDNCPIFSNPNQEDKNDNHIGDVCEDFDLDGWANAIDNCPDNTNRNQFDSDKDGKGDVCDGFESRWIERQSWLPWVGIGFGFLIVIMMMFLTSKSRVS